MVPAERAGIVSETLEQSEPDAHRTRAVEL